MLTQARLRELIDYTPETGVFVWRQNRGGKARAGAPAGAVDSSGHVQIKVDLCSYAAHRLAFLFMLGQWPVAEVDHVNRIRADNRWSNLREATRSQNSVNQVRPNRVGEGRRGVTKFGNRYQAAICVRQDGKKKRLHLGMFATAEEAHLAYLEAAAERHGDFVPRKPKGGQ